MLFMESGRRQNPWYTWQVTAGEDNSGKYDMQKKAKRGDKTEEATFVMRRFKRRTTPAKCSWSATCCLCGRNDVHPTKLNIKRKSSYIWNPQDEAGPVSSNKLGRMSTMVWKSETVTAHYYCLFYAADKDMIQSPHGDNIDTQLEGFPIEVVLDQVEKSEKDSCVFCKGFGACSQCANLRCINHGWYHFPCGLKNGCVQKDGKTWCGRCSGGPTNCQVPSGRRPSMDSKGKKRRGRGMQKRQILPASVESSQSSQELFSNPRSYPAATSSGPRDQLAGKESSQDGDSDGCLLQPISGQQILAEIDRRKEERSKVLENPLRCVSIAQVHQIPKEEFMAEDGLPVKVEANQAVERYSIFHKLPGEEDTNEPLPSSTDKAPEQIVLFDKDTSAFGEQAPRPESRSLLEDNYDDDLETEPFDNSETFGGNQGENRSDPKISLRAEKDSIIVIEDEVESSSENEMEKMRRQMELVETLLKLKRAELEQLEIKRKEEVNFFEKKLQMKDCEMALLKERNYTEMTKKEEEWKAEKKKEEEKWKGEVSRLRSELEKEKTEKDEATRKLDAIYQLARPQGVKREGEYLERFSSQDVGSSAGVKREAEEDKSGEGAEKRARLSCWNF